VTLAYVRACDGDAEEWERRWRELSVALQPPAPPDLDESPYTGLAPFRAEDAAQFFGREALVEEVLDRLTRHRVVVVVGASGTGKTSVLRAGVTPKLVGPTVVLTPGPHPPEECLIRLARLADTPVARPTAGQELGWRHDWDCRPAGAPCWGSCTHYQSRTSGLWRYSGLMTSRSGADVSTRPC